MATKMKIQRTKNDQFIVTIPKAFAELMELEQSTEVKFTIGKNGELIVKKVKKK